MCAFHPGLLMRGCDRLRRRSVEKAFRRQFPQLSYPVRGGMQLEHGTARLPNCLERILPDLVVPRSELANTQTLPFVPMWVAGGGSSQVWRGPGLYQTLPTLAN